MRSEILRQLQSDYEQRRMNNMQEERRRLDAAIRKCPEINMWLDERQNLIFSGMRGILGGTAVAEDIPARMQVINDRIALLLKENGFPEDWLDPVYQCRECRDTGYVGEPVREMCQCMRRAFYRRLYREVGLNEQSEQSFQTFDLSVFPEKEIVLEERDEAGTVTKEAQGYTQRENMQVIRSICEEYAEQYPDARTKDMLLMGQSGLGKTFLMHAMARRLLERGLNVVMISAYRFLEMARKAYFSAQSSVLDDLMNADVLLIDDLGSEPLMENITIVQFFNLINERQSSGRGTVLSTNLTEKELRERYTERIASRLLDASQCELLIFRGDDVRRQ